MIPTQRQLNAHGVALQDGNIGGSALSPPPHANRNKSSACSASDTLLEVTSGASSQRLLVSTEIIQANQVVAIHDTDAARRDIALLFECRQKSRALAEIEESLANYARTQEAVMRLEEELSKKREEAAALQREADGSRHRKAGLTAEKARLMRELGLA